MSVRSKRKKQEEAVPVGTGIDDSILLVLSRLLMSRLRVLRVETFNFPSGQIMPEHLVPEGKLIFMESGSIEYVFENTSFTLDAGKCFYRPPWTKARWTLLKGHSAVLTFCEFTCEPHEHGNPPPMLFSKVSRKLTLESFSRMREALSGTENEHAAALCSEGELKALLARLFTEAAMRVSEKPEEEENPHIGPVQRGIAWLERNFARTDALRELYKKCGLSANHFRKLFREEIGKNPQAKLLEIRLRVARYYIESTMLPIKQVADAVGIPNPRLFARQYRRHWGKTPTEARRQKT